ncbi:hypothetical protein BaRGS_00025191 [Batillaria attramentaria]|uniref:Uncharacterized protein n=1 Tax=Batillaria attramentaria TaxID=370345 RepID=A0ABD0K8U6_9CAEN
MPGHTGEDRYCVQCSLTIPDALEMLPLGSLPPSPDPAFTGSLSTPALIVLTPCATAVSGTEGAQKGGGGDKQEGRDGGQRGARQREVAP